MARQNDYDDIVRTAMILRGESPAAWEQFVLAVRMFSAKEAGNLVAAAPDTLARSQGLAFAAHEFSRVLQEAPALLDKLQAAALTKARNSK